MAPIAPPPLRIHSTQSISPNTALEHISAYLAASKDQAHLHPDAFLTPDHAIYSASSGAQGGLVLHNLRRIEAGLRGERLAAEPEESFEAGDDGRLSATIDGHGSKIASRKRKVDEWDSGVEDNDGVTTLDPSAKQIAKDDNTDEQNGWQSLESFQHEQQPLEGEVGERSSDMATNGLPTRPPALVEHDNKGRVTGLNGDVNTPGPVHKGKKIDKEARKRAKKDRKAIERREREMQKAQQ
ncbi:hypothetical protein LTR66_004769 [Elasticomyces elasticus]|nr:hypothetical protein LTR66_004769 [Elasticomyces elasticus]KAK5008203.1 hypothetical protein LTR28_004286 [Elasticomyces elasticus]